MTKISSYFLDVFNVMEQELFLFPQKMLRRACHLRDLKTIIPLNTFNVTLASKFIGKEKLLKSPNNGSKN